MADLREIGLFGQIEIVCGTNEEFLIGFNINYKEDGTFGLKSTFANHSHCSGIRKLAICGTTLVSGGIDEMIHVFNMKRRGKVGVIGEHEGTITDIQQHKQKYIFSSSEDGKICIFKIGVWQCEKSLVGHKGPINSISIHPTGKIALSVGMDKTLHTWDLIKGRKAFVTNLSEVSSLVRWAPSGDRYVVVMEGKFDVYEVETATKIYSVDLYVRINEILFVDEHMVAVALENGKVCLHHIEESVTLQQWEAHTNRVRAMALMPTVEENESEMLYIVTGSSDGWVKVWSISKQNYKLSAECVTSKNTQCRVTCLAVYSDADYKDSIKYRQQELASSKSAASNKKMKKGRKRQSEEEEESDEEDELEYKPMVKKAKKSVKIIEVVESEDKELIEVFKGDNAMEMLGISTTESQDDGSSITKKSKRRNKGRPAKRLAEDSE